MLRGSQDNQSFGNALIEARIAHFIVSVRRERGELLVVLDNVRTKDRFHTADITLGERAPVADTDSNLEWLIQRVKTRIEMKPSG